MAKKLTEKKWLADDGETWLIDTDDVLTDTDCARLLGCAPEMMEVITEVLLQTSVGMDGRQHDRTGRIAGSTFRKLKKIRAKVLGRAALARGPAAGETGDGGEKD